MNLKYLTEVCCDPVTFKELKKNLKNIIQL